MVDLALVSFSIYVSANPSILKEIRSRLFHPLSLAVAVFAAIFLLASFAGVNPANSFWSNFERGEGALQIIHYAVFFFLLSVLFTSKKDWRNLISFFLAVVFLILLYALGQLLSLDWALGTKITVSGTLGNASYLGSFLTIALILNFWLAKWLEEEKRGLAFRIILGCLFALSLFIFYKTYTAAATGALVAGLAIIIAFIIWKKSKIYKIATILGFILLLIASFLLVSYSKEGQIIGSLRPRFWTWGSALAGIIERPVLGWGPENFPYVFDKYYNPNHYGVETWFDRAHNFFLEYLVSGGVVLLLAYLAIFFFYYRYLFKIRPDSRGKFLEWSLFFIFPVVYLIQGLTLFETLPLYIILFFFLAFFLNYSLNFEGVSFRARFSDQNKIFLAAIAVAAFLSTSLYYSSYLPLKKNLLLMKAVDTKNKSVEQILKEQDRALNFISPLGQGELENGVFLTNFNILNAIQKENSPLGKNKDFIDKIVGLNEKWFERNGLSYVGVKNLYTYTAALLKAYSLTGDEKYLRGAKAGLDNGIKLAPSRLEFLQQEMVIAEIENDTKKLDILELKLKKLRPDLEFIIAK